MTIPIQTIPVYSKHWCITEIKKNSLISENEGLKFIFSKQNQINNQQHNGKNKTIHVRGKQWLSIY